MWSLGLRGSHINHPFRHWMDHSDKVNCTRLQSYSVNLSQASPLSIILPWTSWEFPDYCICNSSFLRHRQIPFSFPPNFLVQRTRKFSYDSACYCSLYSPINQPPSFHLPPIPWPRSHCFRKERIQSWPHFRVLQKYQYFRGAEPLYDTKMEKR